MHQKRASYRFKKLYHGPGYPVDPKNTKTWVSESYVNVFAPQPFGVIDREPLKRWLNDNIN